MTIGITTIAVGCVAAVSCGPSQAMAAKPNVLMIIIDDLRPELGCYGAPQVLTPNIDRLASAGTLFRRAYCNIPVSGASRASLLTGLYPQLPERFAKFDAWAERDAPEAVSVPQWFRDNGYYAVSNGKVFHNLEDHDGAWSEQPWRRNPDGYGADWAEYNKWELWLNSDSGDHVNPKNGRGPFCEAADVPDSLYQDGSLALKAVRDIERLSSCDQPFFLAVGFWRPHLPFNAPKKYWDMYDRDSIVIAANRLRPAGLPPKVTGSGEIRGYGLATDTRTDSFHRQARHGYYACVSFVDAQVGMILDRLEELGLSENTIVVLLGDHGWHLGEHEFWGKHNIMNLSTNSPLIISIPGTPGQQTGAVAEFVDIFPTLCDAAGIPQPEGIEGLSQLPVIDGREDEVKQYAYVQWGKGVNVVDRRYSYTCWPGDGNESGTAMLFDHSEDSGENMNVIDSVRNRETVRRLRRQADMFMDINNTNPIK